MGKTDVPGNDPPTRLMAASICLMPGSVVGRLLEMREGIFRFNSRMGLRTALLYTGGWFVQWHEGPASAVDKTLEMSRSHRTHSHLRVIHRSVGAGCLAEPLQIATLHGQDKPTDVARRLFRIEEERRGRGELDPAEIWLRLSAPLAGPMAMVASAKVPARLLAVTSESTESIDLLKAIAERCRVPVAYQRFATGGVRSIDAGAAYADLGCSAAHTRIHALSRHVLANSLMLLSLRQVHGVLILHGSAGHSHAASRAEAVGRFVARFRNPPRVHAVPAGRGCVEALLDLIAG
ncbi:MAG TPA: BLUF domain-containing protein, partial [Ramlibacter sp.]|nr:BLUF domain-containing protein [Ramlibacter sp.]